MRIAGFVKKAVKAMVPYGILEFYWRMATKIIEDKDETEYCPICKKTSCFELFPYGNPPRPKVRCPHCKSLERHRLLWLFWKKRTTLFDKTPKKILHIAAEECFERRFKNEFNDNYPNYLTADLYNPSAMVRMDITDIHYADESFDIVICNHVLEHVTDDIKAMKEFYRVLKKMVGLFCWYPWQILTEPMKIFPSLPRQEDWRHSDKAIMCGNTAEITLTG